AVLRQPFHHQQRQMVRHLLPGAPRPAGAGRAPARDALGAVGGGYPDGAGGLQGGATDVWIADRPDRAAAARSLSVLHPLIRDAARPLPRRTLPDGVRLFRPPCERASGAGGLVARGGLDPRLGRTDAPSLRGRLRSAVAGAARGPSQTWSRWPR